MMWSLTKLLETMLKSDLKDILIKKLGTYIEDISVDEGYL